MSSLREQTVYTRHSASSLQVCRLFIIYITWFINYDEEIKLCCVLLGTKHISIMACYSLTYLLAISIVQVLLQ